jgi:hypothetical protein
VIRRSHRAVPSAGDMIRMRAESTHRLSTAALPSTGFALSEIAVTAEEADRDERQS